MPLRSWQQTWMDSEVRDEIKKGDQKDSDDDEEKLDAGVKARAQAALDSMKSIEFGDASTFPALDSANFVPT